MDNYTIVVLEDMDYGDVDTYLVPNKIAKQAEEVKERWFDYLDGTYEFSFDIKKYIDDDEVDEVCLGRVLEVLLGENTIVMNEARITV